VRLEPFGRYETIDQMNLSEGTVVASISREVEDTCWDKFLQETPLGQFQQSTIWARVKATEGWRTVRVVLTVDKKIVGGFQILWRSSWRGREGYVSKGPVALPGYPGLAEYATELLRRLGRRERFRALVVQPPDLCKQFSARLAVSGFELDMLARVNETTWIINLRDGFEAVERGMRSETRKKARQAVDRGVKIREGGRDDIQTFFDLMLSTCRRQRVTPSPSDVRTILALWDAARPAGLVRLTFAELEGRPLAGQVDICFGQTVTSWKKGWSSSEAKRFPNDLLTYQALQWATSSGFQFFDFSAFDRSMALAILSGKSLTPDQEKSRYIFLARMGGTPRLLPEARVYFANPIFRLSYRVLFNKKIRQAEENCRLKDALKTSETPEERSQTFVSKGSS
jgi:lipid II:glycine glycyltransferase (peptidoglycan interpeptide bridge formation enzyme)